MKLVWMVLGWLAIAFGVLALVLPLVPTTPFLILAAVCFARCSPRIHDWLVEHRHLGPPIRDWRDHGAVSRGVKLSTVGGFAVAIGFSAAAGMGGWIIASQTMFALAAIAFIVSRPSVPRVAG